MRVIANPRHPADEGPVRAGELPAANTDSDATPCRFVTLNRFSIPRRICVAHPNDNCTDVTADYYDHRTGALRG